MKRGRLWRKPEEDLVSSAKGGKTVSYWRLGHASLLDKIIDLACFPIATRVDTFAGRYYQGASSPEFNLSSGLERLLAGIADLFVAKQRSGEEDSAIS